MSSHGRACHLRVWYLDYFMARHVISWQGMSCHGGTCLLMAGHVSWNVPVISSRRISDSRDVVSIDDLYHCNFVLDIEKNDNYNFVFDY